jgi:hypothetical protein
MTDRRLIAVLISGGYVAALIATWAFASLLLDRDAILEPDAGYLLGPAMVAASGIVVAVVLWRAVRRRALGGPVVAAAASAYLVLLVTGGIGYALISGDLAELLVFPARYALSPFALAAPVLAALAALLLWLATFDRPGHTE